jgi:hypothetical protein
MIQNDSNVVCGKISIVSQFLTHLFAFRRLADSLRGIHYDDSSQGHECCVSCLMPTFFGRLVHVSQKRNCISISIQDIYE